ncbi:MAG: flagellar hook-associated protein FlgK [Sedimentisphaerales bacterium]|nr:flagellar hook-associated protein FlgK [Sedimentisphaerales bacterium]
MDSYDVAISGLSAAQQAFEVIGNNIANAATEGYHLQRLNLTPAFTTQIGDTVLGGGVDIGEVTRAIDTLLEKEIYRQQSSFTFISQELNTLKSVETVFGELSSESGLNAAIDDFFNALKDLSAHPSEIIYQEQAVSSAESMANRFQLLDDYLTKLETQLKQETDNVVKEINSLTKSITELNGKIQNLVISGGNANNLRDQRDQCIAQLSELVNVETLSRDHGVVDLSIEGIPVCAGISSLELEAGLDENGMLGITIAGESNYSTDIQGGQLGGLCSLKNRIISNIHNDLNNLASEIIQQINQNHVQGVGSEGSFTDITGSIMVSEDLADFQPVLSDGSFSIRVTDTATGQVTRTTIPIDVSADSLTDIAADISAITGLNASVSNSTLRIQADSGYEFDFLPAVLSEPTASDFSGTSSAPSISMSGIYSGTENQTFTFNVSGTGSVGNGTLEISVADGNGDIVKILNVGSGYSAGDELEICNGIKISFSLGDLADGNTFEVDALSQSDTTGLLAALGINTFFSGRSASDISVNSNISDDPKLIATSIGPEMTDNENVLRFAELKDIKMENLNSMTFGDFYRKLVTDIGIDISTRNILQDNMQASIQNFTNQQGEISGVNLNDEAAKLLVFEQMFQGMAKYLGTLQNSVSIIMDII